MAVKKKVSHPNYAEQPEGFWKKVKSVVKGGASYFERPIPPMRDGAGRPMIDADHVDWQRWADEIEEARDQ